MVNETVVAQLCTDATRRMSGGRGAVLEVVTDPLDRSIWVRFTSWPRANEAAATLIAHGLSVVERRDCRLQVSGWDARALRRRLGTLIAGIDDLRVEWDATAELTRYHRDRRANATGEPPDDFDVVTDVERTLRDARPMPRTASGADDVDTLLQLVDAAEDAYAQLLVQHVEYAAAVLVADAASTDQHRPAPH